MIQQSNIKIVDIITVRLIRKQSNNRKFKGIEKEGEKTCARCMKSKLLKYFHNVPISTDGKRSWCGNCINKYNLAYNHKETRRVKLICMMGYGGKCVCCGDSRIEMLTIEHIRYKGYDLIYDSSILRLMRKLIGLDFPDGYTCLCYGCNSLTRLGKPCEHSNKWSEYYDKNIKPYSYTKQKELEELEHKWEIMNEGG